MSSPDLTLLGITLLLAFVIFREALPNIIAGRSPEKTIMAIIVVDGDGQRINKNRFQIAPSKL